MAAAHRAERPRPGLPLIWLLAVLGAHLAVLAWPLPAPGEPPPAPTAPAAPVLQTRQVVLLPAAAPAAPTPPPKPPPVKRPAPRPVQPAPITRATPAPPEPPAVVAEAPASEPAAEPAPAPEAPPAAEPAPPSVQAPEPTPEPPPVSTEGPPAHLPPATRLSYTVEAHRNGARYDAVGVLTWQPEGDRYELRLEWRAFFLSRQQSSTGRLAADGLHPERFAERTRGERAAHFDEAGGRVRFSANTPDAPLKPGAQDRLSLLLQLAGRFNARPDAFPAGTTLRLPVASARDLQEWVLTVEGEETLELPGETLPTVRLLRLPRREFDQKVEIWLAPSLGHLPVRVRLTEANGDVADQKLSGR